MAKRRKKYDIRDFQLTGDARTGYTYFVLHDHDAKAIKWELVAPNGDTLCSSRLFYDKADCVKTLRAVQRHGASTDVRDDVH
jgi:uncharacterized protein YegP (UPF0339 family)